VHAGLELHLRVDLLAPDPERDLLVAAALRLARVDLLGLPVLQVGVAHVHAVQVAREDRRLVATGTCPDLDDDVLVVVRVAGEHHHLELVLEPRDARLDRLDLVGGHLLEVGVALGPLHLLGRLQLVAGQDVLPRLVGQRLAGTVLAGQPGILLLVLHDRRIAQASGQVVVGPQYLFEFRAHGP